MSEMILRATFGFALHDDGAWYADKARVRALVDVVLDSDLAPAFTHAGRYAEEKPAKGAAAIRKAVVTGRSGGVTMMDAATAEDAHTKATFDLDDDSLDVTIEIGPPVLAARAGDLLATLEAIGVGLVGAMKDLGGLAKGFVQPMGRGFIYPRVRPPVMDRRFPPDSILDLVDLAFHRSEHDWALAEAAAKLAKAAVPKEAQRTTHGELVAVRWIDSVADERAVAVATGRHEQWISRVLPMEREPSYNEAGNLLVELSERTSRAPFTMYDSDEGIGYKAIIVDPRGEPDDEVWAQMKKALAARKSGLKGIRLIAPLRKLALALAPEARKAGFGAVLYPGDDNSLWDPAPPGWWIDDEPDGGRTKSAGSRR